MTGEEAADPLLVERSLALPGTLESVAEKVELGLGKAQFPIRVAVTGSDVGPPLRAWLRDDDGHPPDAAAIERTLLLHGYSGCGARTAA